MYGGYLQIKRGSETACAGLRCAGSWYDGILWWSLCAHTYHIVVLRRCWLIASPLCYVYVVVDSGQWDAGHTCLADLLGSKRANSPPRAPNPIQYYAQPLNTTCWPIEIGRPQVAAVQLTRRQLTRDWIRRA